MEFAVISLTVAGPLLLLAIAHSILGERDILGPLFASDWGFAETPRWATERVLRFAWHATSIWWAAMGLVFVGLSIAAAVAIASIATAAMIFAMLRGHAAWPLFLIAGLGALRADELLPDVALATAGWFGVAIAMAAALWHLYWAAGGQMGRDAALPTGADGSPAFNPGAALTAAVAMLLIGYGGLVSAELLDRGHPAGRWLLFGATLVFGLRSIGDGDQVGFSKTDRSTAFARRDDSLFTPIAVALTFTTTATLLA